MSFLISFLLALLAFTGHPLGMYTDTSSVAANSTQCPPSADNTTIPIIVYSDTDCENYLGTLMLNRSALTTGWSFPSFMLASKIPSVYSIRFYTQELGDSWFIESSTGLQVYGNRTDPFGKAQSQYTVDTPLDVCRNVSTSGENATGAIISLDTGRCDNFVMDIPRLPMCQNDSELFDGGCGIPISTSPLPKSTLAPTTSYVVISDPDPTGTTVIDASQTTTWEPGPSVAPSGCPPINGTFWLGWYANITINTFNDTDCKQPLDDNVWVGVKLSSQTKPWTAFKLVTELPGSYALAMMGEGQGLCKFNAPGYAAPQWGVVFSSVSMQISYRFSSTTEVGICYPASPGAGVQAYGAHLQTDESHDVGGLLTCPLSDYLPTTPNLPLCQTTQDIDYGSCAWPIDPGNLWNISIPSVMEDWPAPL